ncbi:TraB/GumN family protein [Gluconobacter albidus]|uniref:TraB/GumN family protein n=1 Tax=Gluconobacter albidus TaxID=318683 RepID=UPI001FC9914D|nr:TraB/GumN family protein [Gluconobacter albidus]
MRSHRFFQSVAGLVLVFCTGALAQAPRCPAAASVPEKARMGQMFRTAPDRGFLWKVTKDGHSSWLYGTLHVAKQDWLMPGPLTRSAILHSSKVALELDLNAPDTATILRQPEDAVRWAHLVQSGRKVKVDALMDQQCVPSAAFAHVAVGVEAAGVESLASRWDGYYPDYAVDAVLQGMAGSLKKPLIGLETVQMQRDLLIGPDQADEDAFIDDIVKGVSSGKTQTENRRLAEMWASSDVKRLDAYRDWCDCLNTAQERRFMSRLLDDRNVGMAQKIEQLHAGGASLFVAVGSLHMAGPKGLPALLRKDGFEVQQIVPAL